MSNVSEIQFAVEKSVLDIGVKIVFLVIEGIDNTRISPEWMEKRKGIIANLLNDYKDIDYHADPVLEGFHILHDRAGVKRRKNIPASENLIRLLNKHGDVFFINQAVDIYNIISMENKLALGAHVEQSVLSRSGRVNLFKIVRMNTVIVMMRMRCFAVWRSDKWKKPKWMRKQQMRFISYRAMKQLITNFCSLLPRKSWMKRSNTVAAKAG